jgi:hypothetical protein
MNYRRAVQATLRYVVEHLEDDISLEALCENAGY